jgi:hypothetical protein
MVSDKKIFMGISHMYYGIFYELWTFAYFDRLCKLEKGGMQFKKKSSPLKLQSQSQPNFAEMILGWSSSKIVSGISEHLGWKSGSPDTILEGGHTRIIPQNLVAIGPVVSEEKIFMWISHRVPMLSLLWNYLANLNQTLLKWSLGGALSKLCPAFQDTDQDGRHSRT